MQLLVLAALAALALAQPNLDYYQVDAIFSLPYAGITEPVRVYYDYNNNKSRTGTACAAVWS